MLVNGLPEGSPVLVLHGRPVLVRQAREPQGWGEYIRDNYVPTNVRVACAALYQITTNLAGQRPEDLIVDEVLPRLSRISPLFQTSLPIAIAIHEVYNS